MNRRSFLARIPTAVAVLPFVGGLTAFAGASEPEVQQAVAVVAQHPSVLEFIDGEPVYDSEMAAFLVNGWSGAGWYLRSPGQSWNAALSIGAKADGVLARSPYRTFLGHAQIEAPVNALVRIFSNGTRLLAHP